MRSITSMVIVVLAATSKVMGCSDGDITIRCGQNSETGRNGWGQTEYCMKKLGNSRDCYCWGNTRYFAVANNNFGDFIDCCKSYGHENHSQCP